MSEGENVLSAIRSFDVDAVEKMLKSECDIESGFGDSVLHSAVQLIDAARSKDKSNKEAVNGLYWSEALRRIVEALLQSRRFNVNALTYNSKTPLHHAVEYCKCTPVSIHDDKDLVTAVVELLLKNNANINAKSGDGETPLMKASERGCSPVVKLLLNWRDEHGAGVDLNARDIHGETALIKAAKYARVDVVELLLEHGCLDEFQDHRGFYALHAVIYGLGVYDDVISSFLAAIGIFASDKMPVMFDQYAAQCSEYEKWLHNEWPENDLIQKIVILLLMRGRADISSKDFRGNTVLDVAFKSKPAISEETIEMLKKCGACFSTSMNKHLENSENTFLHADKLGKTPLHRFCVINRLEVYDVTNRLKNNQHKDLCEAMAAKQDHRGRTALHYAVVTKHLCSEEAFQLTTVLNLEHIINEKDIYGRTPLHYCDERDVYKSLVAQGANEDIKDIDGMTPRELNELRMKEAHRRRLSLTAARLLELLFNEYKQRRNYIWNLGGQSSERKLDAWMIWKDSEYAFRDQFSTVIRDKLQQFMNKLSEEIMKRDSRFECRPVLIGSAEEGTKTGLPDEFDFNFVLTKLSELCEVVPSPEAPSGFVHIRRRPCNDAHSEASRDFKSQEGLYRLFNSSGFLLTTEIASRFRILYSQIMSEPEFWEGENSFEWDIRSEVGLVYHTRAGLFDDSKLLNDFSHSTHSCSTIQLKLSRPIEGRYMFRPISVDIAPCIKINGWWPEGTLSGVDDEAKVAGCHLVFDQPQRNYPWVPFSDPFARISFAPAEDCIIKECSAVARAAYMVGKHLLHYVNPRLTYVLKTCLLYCIEALNDYTRTSLAYEDIKPSELRLYVEKLMLCSHEFQLQDFVPCYMMPSFTLPLEGRLKFNHDLLLTNSSFRFRYPVSAYWLYQSVRTTEFPEDFCPPTPAPLDEKFNKVELMRKLSMNVGLSEIEHRHRECPVVEEIVQSDNQCGSQVRFSAKRKRKVTIVAARTILKRARL